MLKVFISQPMGGISDEVIKSERSRAIDNIKQKFGENVEILNTLFEEEPPEYADIGIWYLGESIKVLAMADVAYFVRGWDTKRGCRIEYTCAKEYGIEVVEEQ